jgi:hypothetical protein
MQALRSVIDFFALRPFFTLRSLRALWWIYILVWGFELYDGLNRRLTHLPGATVFPWFRAFRWLDVALFPLVACAAIMATRLLVEVLMNLLSIPSRNMDLQRRPPSVWQTLEAFVALTPFVTRRWLERFWWFFLIVMGWIVISNVVLGPSILNSILGTVAYVASVRLLLESATRLLRGGAATAAEGDIGAARHVADLFSLQRILTFGSIKVLWWLYILVELHRLFLRLGTVTVVGSLPPSLYRYMWHNVFVAPLMTLITIATARLFLEVLMRESPGVQAEAAEFSRNPPALSDGLSDFINLRPFFTPWRLQLFWWLFLFTILADVYGYVSLVPGQQPISHWVPYVMGFLKPVYCVVGVRLLIEAARREA